MSKTFIRKYITISTSVPLKITTDRANQVLELLPGFYQFENEKDERYTFTPDIGAEVKVSDTDVFFCKGVRSVDGELDALDADIEMMAGAMEAMGDSIETLVANDTALDARLSAVETAIEDVPTLPISLADLAAGVQTSLGKADTAIQSGTLLSSIANGSIEKQKLKLDYSLYTSPTIANGSEGIVSGPGSANGDIIISHYILNTVNNWKILSLYRDGSTWKIRVKNESGSSGTCDVMFISIRNN